MSYETIRDILIADLFIDALNLGDYKDFVLNKINELSSYLSKGDIGKQLRKKGYKISIDYPDNDPFIINSLMISGYLNMIRLTNIKKLESLFKCMGSRNEQTDKITWYITLRDFLEDNGWLLPEVDKYLCQKAVDIIIFKKDS